MQYRISILSLMVIIAFLIFSALLVFTLTYSVDTTGIYEKDGLILSGDNNLPFSGVLKDTVENKIIEFSVTEGIKSGSFAVYDINGQLEIKGVVDNNKNEGTWSYYSPAGVLESQGTFKDDKLNGKWNWYYPDGKIRRTGFFKNDKKDNIWKEYDRSGNLIFEVTYKNGVEKFKRNFNSYWQS